MCTNPHKGFQIGLTVNGKARYLHFPMDVDHIRRAADGRWLPIYKETAEHMELVNGGKLNRVSSKDVIYDWVPFKCQKCTECRLEQSREWANRLMLEKKSYEHCYFVTLTYDDLHVPTASYKDPESGSDLPSLTLNPDDLKDWFKRLRKAFAAEYGAPVAYRLEDPSTWKDPRRVRYYACGEYGKKTFRPHYHAIIFSPKIPGDYKLWEVTWNGDKLYTCDFLDKTWAPFGDKKGIICFGEVTWESCAYVARYVLKKLKGTETEFYTLHNLVPEFSRSSKKPGIAACYYLDHPDCLSNQYINISTEKKGIKFFPPRYFKKLDEQLGCIDPNKEDKLKRASKKYDNMMMKTTLTFDEYMQVRDNAIQARAKKLIRRMEDAQ